MTTYVKHPAPRFAHRAAQWRAGSASPKRYKANPHGSRQQRCHMATPPKEKGDLRWPAWGSAKGRAGVSDSECLVSREISNVIVPGQQQTTAHSRAGALGKNMSLFLEAGWWKGKQNPATITEPAPMAGELKGFIKILLLTNLLRV